ncbi:dephospho-CoA kinase [Anoxybacter fermentans]|uniref:Dephospho-CoA kinase n=1 Tax=Anoxybacter fermentans TaxID=1323375 RepID=A0A3S9SZL2_9FIRM|nr:dephospho-CoA kinase [Anoxybacter fermentans]AZR73719.1 dephospho-CoA kinase [Anoxybacter fermentans]
MYRIGLTGGIASGKSTVAKFLAEMGLAVINLDLISREILDKGTPGYREVLATFGQTILNSEKEIDRKALGEIVFNDPALRKKLESITHPLILEKMEERIQKLKEAGKRVVVVEVPLLFEAGLENKFDQIWLVYVDQETQIKRLMARNGLNREEALMRLKAQMPLDIKKTLADHIIYNTGDLEDLKEHLQQLWRDIKCKELL